MRRGRRETACLKSSVPGKGCLVLSSIPGSRQLWVQVAPPHERPCWGRGGAGRSWQMVLALAPQSLCSVVSLHRSLVGASGLEGAIRPRPWRRTGSCGGSGGCRLSMRHKSKVRGRFRPGVLRRPRVSAADPQITPRNWVEQKHKALLLGASLAPQLPVHALPPASLLNLGRLLLTQTAMTLVA